MGVGGVLATPAPVVSGAPPTVGGPAVEGDGVGVMEEGTPRGGRPPITPMRELRDCRGCRIGGRGGESGQEEGEGEIGSGEGRNIPAGSPCCCCWNCCCCCCCSRVMATLVVAAAVCRGAWTNGAQITGRGWGDTVPPVLVRVPAVISCMVGILSCLTICWTRMLSHEPAAPEPPPRPPPPGPRPRLLPATDPP